MTSFFGGSAKTQAISAKSQPNPAVFNHSTYKLEGNNTTIIININILRILT